MILTDFYKFERLAVKSKQRLDCTLSTESYNDFEERRATKATKASERLDATNVGDLVIYLGRVPDRFGGNVHQKADMSISIKGKNMSSVYVQSKDALINGFGYGDFRGTADALLFVFHDCKVVDSVIQAGAVLEVFVARGKSKDRVPLLNLLADGELDEEMQTLRGRAVTKSVT